MGNARCAACFHVLALGNASRILVGMSPCPKCQRYSGIPWSNPTKTRVLELMAGFFCLRSKDAAFLLRNRAITETDERSVRRTLAILHRDGLLARFDLSAGLGTAAYVYGLSDRGVNHAFENGYSTPATKTLDEHSLRTLDHELEITAFHIALHQLSLSSGIVYSWRQTDLKHTIHPDAFFTITDRQDANKEHCFFLEIERSKLGNYRDGEPQILRKLGAFYDYFNSTGCEKEWGLRHFRVVVVQRTDARRQGLLKVLRAKYNHRMFWLTTEDEFRRDIGAPIFMTPKDDAPVSFSSLTS